MDRINCIHFEYKYFGENDKKIIIPSCKIGKMKGTSGCDEYCEWFESKGPEIPTPPISPEPPEPLKPL
jgi:hypothetical protein